ncbi:glycosyltransferase family 2 protein [Acidianus sp. RZ1]|uniref:glycosyltransferase family 2 protein n=1 Tax=Acidianus sp. RZ1 TaxID=1540082 RepID=UPI001490F000|nr:glycosyltransferase family 2 protein [Acidianus sp. RZ1]NON63500.1 glycosyltransferase family 2 protein [Acidianus sp. RZ1]
MEKIPIVIVNYNGLSLLQKYLKSVMDTDYDEKEVIVVDNGSKDDSVNYAKNMGTTVISLDKNYGPSYARNIAIRKFKTRYMAFLDNDVMVNKDWLLYLFNEINNERVAACQSLYSNWPYNDEPREIPWFSTAAVLTRRDYLEKVGGFDEHYFFYWEDVDLSWRLYKAGYKILMVPKSKVYHEVHGTYKKLPSPFTTYLNWRNQLLILLTFYSKKDLVLKFPLIYVIRIFQSFYGPNKVSKIKATFSILNEFSYIIRKREEISKLEKVKGTPFIQMLGDDVFGYLEFKSIYDAIRRKVSGHLF